jgi:hypothetical protein
MNAQPKILPIPLSGLTLFRIDSAGSVFRIDPMRAANRRRVEQFALNALEGQWRRHGDPGGTILLEQVEGGLVRRYTRASFHPNPSFGGIPRRIQVAPGDFVTNVMPPMTEQHHFPLPEHCNPEAGWYKLPGFSYVPVGTDSEPQMVEQRGLWYFHGPSVANEIFS